MIISYAWKMEAKRIVLPDNFWHTSNWIDWTAGDTLQGTNISPQNGILKMIFLFPRWDMLIPWRVFMFMWSKKYLSKTCGGVGLAESKPRRSLFHTSGSNGFRFFGVENPWPFLWCNFMKSSSSMFKPQTYIMKPHFQSKTVFHMKSHIIRRDGNPSL